MRNKKTLPFIYLIFITILTYLPVIVAIVYSFNASKLSSVWGGFTLSWYKEVFSDSSIGQAVLYSLLLGLISSILSAIIATMFMLVVRKKSNRSDKLVKGIAMIPLMIPEVIFGMAYLAFFNFFNISFGIGTLIIAHMSFCIPYIMLQLESRIQLMEDSQYEASRIMGASKIRAFFDVTLPYLMPSLISGMFLSFAMSFDDVVLSMFVTGPKVNTIALKIYSQVKTTLTPKVNAICTLLFIGTMICLILASILGRKKTNTIDTKSQI